MSFTPLSDEARKSLEVLRQAQDMTEEDFIQKCLSTMMDGWIPLELYLRMYPTESANKVHMRVHKGIWQRQLHYASPTGGGAWVNLPAIRLWLLGLLGPWCCEEGERLQVQICPTCLEASEAYRRATSPESSGGSHNAG